MDICIKDAFSDDMLTPDLIRYGIYGIQFLDKSHFPKVMGLQDIIDTHLPNRETYRIDTPEYVSKHFTGRYNILGAFHLDELIAYLAVSFPEKTDEHFGRDVHLAIDQFTKAAHFETVAVHPAHRGNKLLRIMAVIQLQYLEHFGYEHVLCTVSPLNYPSLTNVFQLGFIIRALKEKNYGLRYTMYKNLKKPVVINKQRAIRVKNSEIDAQQQLLAQGYYGFSLDKTSDGLEILYGRARGMYRG
jgi:ribosomal protein S18 acetylase RimI-like enzyme